MIRNKIVMICNSFSAFFPIINATLFKMFFLVFPAFFRLCEELYDFLENIAKGLQACYFYHDKKACFISIEAFLFPTVFHRV
jgi:hypothetical protein